MIKLKIKVQDELREGLAQVGLYSRDDSATHRASCLGVVHLSVLRRGGFVLPETIPQRIGAYRFETHRDREDLVSGSTNPPLLSTLKWITPKILSWYTTRDLS